MNFNANIYKYFPGILAHLEQAMTDSDALDYIGLFDAWRSDTDYVIGDRVRDNDVLYKCIQSHTSQSDWQPHLTPALWVVVSIEEWPEWVQPVGSTDAYAEGAKVSHNGKHWISDVDNNVWEPSVYGWTEAE